MNKLPLARSADIVVQTLDKEILIYDLKSHKAYSLNETSSRVYQACDGKTSFNEFKKATNFTDDLIFLALDQLKKDNLIEVDQSFVLPFNGMSRREAIKKIGLGSMVALPVISTLVAPTAADAQSRGNLAFGQTCTLSSQCSSSAPNCATRIPGGTRRCCIGSVSYYDAGGLVNSCSGGDCSSATFSCQSDANQFCCSNSATASCTGDSCACRCN